MEEELKLVSVSGDHTAVLWDVSIMPFRQLRQFRGHTRSVKTVAFRPQDKSEIIVLFAADNFFIADFVHVSDHHSYSFRPNFPVEL
jgi:WD40 repeat protein